MGSSMAAYKIGRPIGLQRHGEDWPGVFVGAKEFDLLLDSKIWVSPANPLKFTYQNNDSIRIIKS